MLCALAPKTACLFMYQAQALWLADLPSKTMSSTAGSHRSSGALWHRALVLARGWAMPLHARVDPRSTTGCQRQPGGGSGRPPSNPQELQTAWSAHFQKSMDFRKRPATKVWRALPRSQKEDAESSPKIWRALPRPLAGNVPEGVVLRPPRRRDVPLWGSIEMMDHK